MKYILYPLMALWPFFIMTYLQKPVKTDFYFNIIMIILGLSNLYETKNVMIMMFLILIYVVDYNYLWIPDYSIIGIGLINILSLIYESRLRLDGLIFILIICVMMIILSLILKTELIGFGDLKLYLVLSIGLSFIESALLLFLSSVIGIIFFVFVRKRKFAFGPSIVLAYMVLIKVINIIE